MSLVNGVKYEVAYWRDGFKSEPLTYEDTAGGMHIFLRDTGKSVPIEWEDGEPAGVVAEQQRVNITIGWCYGADEVEPLKPAKLRRPENEQPPVPVDPALSDPPPEEDEGSEAPVQA